LSNTTEPAAIEILNSRYYCTGTWTLHGIPGFQQRLSTLSWPATEIELDMSQLHALDTGGALLLVNTIIELRRQGHELQLVNLHSDHRALIDLVIERSTAYSDTAAAADAKNPLTIHPLELNSLARLGQRVIRHFSQMRNFLDFTGVAGIAFARATLQPRRWRLRALFIVAETAGANALPIIALMSFLMGVVIAYQGGLQLQAYGANIFIVELVCLTMLRELAPLITAIMVAGRTGSSFTAQIGTMQVTEEVDALRTIGIDPMDMLVLPKLLALVIALPLLTIFADILSIFGGMVMAKFLLNVSFSEFLKRIPEAVTVTSLMIGVGKAPVFAAIIALVGCYQGFQVSGSADSVGRHTTDSVVQSIFLVITADAAFSIVLGSFGV
jgi:phospholipid/cholesterol/gamma-HCH transport system permease protein